MNEFANYMVDIETFSTETNAAIVSIGAVFMSFDRGFLGSEFYYSIDLKSSVDSGGHMQPETVGWWMQQSDEARKILFKNTVSLRHALLGLSDFLDSHDGDPRVWGNGATFDNVILRSAYKSEKIDFPWHFKNDMCYRTEVNLNPEIEKDEREGTYHNALDDAKFQARHLFKILKANGKIK